MKKRFVRDPQTGKNTYPQMPSAFANQWAGCACTLNGKPAKVTGRLCRFANVGTLDGSLSVEYAWETVNKIMRENRGEFRSE